MSATAKCGTESPRYANGSPVTLLWRGSASDLTVIALDSSLVADWMRGARDRSGTAMARIVATAEYGAFIAGDAPMADGVSSE